MHVVSEILFKQKFRENYAIVKIKLLMGIYKEQKAFTRYRIDQTA